MIEDEGGALGRPWRDEREEEGLQAGSRGRVLLHMCCGPCAVWPVRALREAGYDVTGLWYNPNIHPAEEYGKRLASCRIFAEKSGLGLIERGGYGLREFIERVYPKDVEGRPGVRCLECYRWRLEETARAAREHGFERFSTTLLVSPYQQHEAIAAIGREVAEDSGLEFFYADWRGGFRGARRESREMGLYHQVYCGCLLSEAERFAPRAAVRRTGTAHGERPRREGA